MKIETSPVAERPLPESVLFRLMLSATAVIGLFYLFVLLSLLAVGAVIFAEFAILLAMTRFALARFMVAPLGAQLRLGSLLLTSLNLKPGVEYNVELRREEAPRLFALLEDVAGRVGVRPPDSVRLEMSGGAWVRLRDYRQGRGHSVLGIGYELLAVLTEAEFRAVMAHEMAHARLVQRGYRGWMMNGILRIQRFARSVDVLRVDFESGKKARRFHSAALLARIAASFARAGTRSAALYSRQDEFAADRRAAEVCGAEVCREALLLSHLTGERSRNISWKDYLVRTQRRESLGDWMRARLLPADAADRREWEQRALAETHRNEYSTHPLLIDRIAALPPDAAPLPASPPALSLLDDPDRAAARLIDELERTALEQEQKASRELRKWIRKQIRPVTYFTPLQGMGIILMIIGGMFTFMMAASLGFDSSLPWSEEFATICLPLPLFLLGILVFRIGRYKDHRSLPFPSLSAWDTARKADRPSDDGWKQDMVARLEGGMPPDLMPSGMIRKRKMPRARYWAGHCYDALERCDYATAWAAGSLCLKAEPRHFGGLVGMGVASAYFGDVKAVNETVSKAVNRYGLNPSTSVGMAWALMLLGHEWEKAEAYLHDALARRPDEPTLHALLAYCQWHQGKFREARRNLRRAAELQPDEPRHRIQLMRLLTLEGRVREAAELLGLLLPQFPDDEDVLIGAVTVDLMLDRPDEAQTHAGRLETIRPGAKTALDLARAYQDAERKEDARRYFDRARAEGFYPEALIGLARLDYEDKRYDEARAYLLDALDLTREPGPDSGARPVELLGVVFRGLRAMREPEPGCSAWEVLVPMTASSLGLQELTLFVCAPGADEAKSHAREVFHAMLPNQDLPEAEIRATRAPEEHQPQGPVIPGIYGHHFD